MTPAPISGPDARKAQDILRELRFAFRQNGILTGDLDARLLLECIADISTLDLMREPDQMISAEVADRLADALSRRLAGESVHRILGFREFHGLRLDLSTDTLEPRPDTEILVDEALPFVLAQCREKGECQILDLGTGTGAIALSLIAADPRVQAIATDISQGALEAATRNAQFNGLEEQFETILSNWFDELADKVEPVDLIISNPPYIRSEEIQTLQTEVVGHDPLRALDGGADGLDAYREIAKSARHYLKISGRIMLEIGWDQCEDVTSIFQENGFRLLDVYRDYGGNDRVLSFAAGQ